MHSSENYIPHLGPVQRENPQNSAGIGVESRAENLQYL